MSTGPRGECHSRCALRVEELCAQFGDLVSGDSGHLRISQVRKLELLGLRGIGQDLLPAAMSARHGVTIDFHYEGAPDDLPNDVALAMFRAYCRRRSTMPSRHAAVRRVSVSLGGSRDEMRLDVADEGVGFDLEAAMRSHGLGLIGMRERLSLVDGECLIESQPGAGPDPRARAAAPRTQRRANSIQEE